MYTIVVSDTFISDHRMITVETNIHVHGVAPKHIFNPPSNKFAVLDFHKTDWPNIFCHFNLLTGWPLLNKFHHLLVFIILLTLYIINVCIMFPLKIPVKPKSLNSIEREKDFDAKTDKAPQNEFHEIYYSTN